MVEKNSRKVEPGCWKGATCTVCNVLHGWSRGQKSEKQNRDPNPNKNAGAGYQGLVKVYWLIELFPLLSLMYNFHLH